MESLNQWLDRMIKREFYIQGVGHYDFCDNKKNEKILIPMSAVVDRVTVSLNLFVEFSISFYQNAKDAVFKALKVE